MAKIVELEIKDLEIPQGLLPRVITGTVESKVEEYKELIEEGVEFDPISVWEREDGRYWVIDGVHRIEAHKRAGLGRIKAKLVKCKDELDYRIKAIQANLKHGLALAKGERPILAQMLYKQGLDEEAIRKVFGVSERTLRRWLKPVKEQEREEKVKKALELRKKGWSLEKIAKELNVDKATVSRLLQKGQNDRNATPLPLLTPYGAPTPEGVRAWDSYMVQASVEGLEGVYDPYAFAEYLKNRGFEPAGSVQLFIERVKEEIENFIKKAVKNGLPSAEVRLLLSKTKQGIFENISFTGKAKLANLYREFIEEKEKEHQEELKDREVILKEAEEVLKDPTYVFHSWTYLAEDVVKRLPEEITAKYRNWEIAQILQEESTKLLDIYNATPEATHRDLKETADGLDIDSMTFEEFKKALKEAIIEKGKRPAKVEEFASYYWNEYQKLKEEEEIQNIGYLQVSDEEIAKVAEELSQLDLSSIVEEAEGEKKTKRGRPKKEEERPPLSPGEQYLRAVEEIQYWVLWILDRWGREDAIRTLENLIEDLKTLSNEELWKAWKMAYGRAVADGRIRPWTHWDKWEGGER